MYTSDDWKNFFLSKGFAEKEIHYYLETIEKLCQNQLPIILDFNHLCLLLGVSKTYLASVVNSSENHWRSFKLKKKSGGYRNIDVPYPSLLYVQNWIYNNILSKISCSGYAHGFVRNKSIISNARWHIGQKELLKLDLKDFFPSIKINRIIALFNDLGYDKKVSYYLSSICCLNGVLPQGSPTSPVLSNLICRPLDYRVSKLARLNSLHYTRYADDLTFSGDDIRVSLINTILSIINDEGFDINKDKTRLYKRKCKRIVTGICVGNKLTVPRDFKRKIKQEVFYIKKYGLLDHLEKSKCKERNYCKSLLGRICFWLQVEPNNDFAINSKKHILKLMRNGFSDY